MPRIVIPHFKCEYGVSNQSERLNALLLLLQTYLTMGWPDKAYHAAKLLAREAKRINE